MKLAELIKSKNKSSYKSKLLHLCIINNTKLNLNCILEIIGDDFTITINEKKEEKNESK